MDTNLIYVFVGCLVLFVVYEIMQVKTSNLSQKTKLLSYFSSVLVGIYITALLYVGPDIKFFILISVFCVPFWIYYTYIRFKEDKKNVLTLLGIAGLMVLTVWLYGI